MTNQQILFFEELSYIQEYCVNVALCNSKRYESDEERLRDITHEAIYRVMELIDGYACDLPKFMLINTETGEALNEEIELHDKCVECLSNPLHRNEE